MKELFDIWYQYRIFVLSDERTYEKINWTQILWFWSVKKELEGKS